MQGPLIILQGLKLVPLLFTNSKLIFLNIVSLTNSKVGPDIYLILFFLSTY